MVTVVFDYVNETADVQWKHYLLLRRSYDGAKKLANQNPGGARASPCTCLRAPYLFVLWNDKVCGKNGRHVTGCIGSSKITQPFVGQLLGLLRLFHFSSELPSAWNCAKDVDQVWLQFPMCYRLGCCGRRLSHTPTSIDVVYEGRSINKLQNDIIPLIFKTWKFGNTLFVGNLIGDIHWNFYDGDVIIVMSLVLRTQAVSAVFCPADLFYNSQLLNNLASYEKWEQL